ncbi:MAG: O-antigen ligase family protein, partial [Chloroflexi bacterium]|nr:O-antigen ligase family protein [Chloroflexota bacterium]
ATGAAAFVLSVSLIGTASRGPWVGAFAGGITAVVLLAIYGRTRLNIKPIAVATALIALGALLVTFVDPTPLESTTSDETDSSAISSTLIGVGRTNTLDIRLRYWKLSADISTNREPVPQTTDAPKIVRLLLGYGPDSFRFAGTYFADSTTFTRRITAAHNDPINRLVEQGILGFLAWIGLWLSVAYGCLTLIRRSGNTLSNPYSWIAIAISVAFVSRFVEQLFGSPTPGGVLIFWILVGALSAMILSCSTHNERKQKVRSSSALTQYASYTAVLVILITSITVGWDKGANYLIANQKASFLYRTTVVPADEAIERLEKAAHLAPDVPRYWHDLAEIEHGRATSTENLQLKAAALSRAYEYNLKGYEANPMEIDSIYKLAFSAWESGGTGRPELRQEAVRLYERIIEIVPSDKLAKERLQLLNDFLSQ